LSEHPAGHFEGHSSGVSPATVPVASEPIGASAGHGVNHLGYRGWSGRRSPGWLRWTVISAVGVRRAWPNKWLKRMLLLAWLPALWFGIGFFLWEQAALYPDWRDTLTPFLQGMPHTPEFANIRQSLQTGNMADGRHTVWAWLLQTFFRYPQGVLMVMVVGVIAPPLISQDIRSRAFLLYFSRPLTRSEYLLGKLGSVWAYMLLISMVPALSLYMLGVLLSPNLGVFADTWDLPFRIMAASVVLILPTSVMALCFSSLTQESRYAGFAWFAVWILGWFTYGAATSAEAFNAQQAAFRGQPQVEMAESAWTHLSLYHTLGRVQRWVFGFADFRDVLTSTVIVVAVTVLSLAILYRRISAPMRI
jgi:ABC-type transport system involved in multi-copper enzyme maturation permease subunit